MSEAVKTPEVRLDRVMLAMDVVDTLRHQQALVESELDDTRRQMALTARVQSIYESQGIEVSDSVIREAVRALRDDRFVYKPPERTVAVRFAEIYVERGKWAKRAGIVVLVGLLVWAAFAVPIHFRRQALMQGFEQSVVQLEIESRELEAVAAGLAEELERSRQVDDTAAIERLHADAEDNLLDGTAQVESVITARNKLPDPEVYVEDRTRWDPVMRSYSEINTEAGAAFNRVRGSLDLVGQLRSLQVRFDAAKVRLAAVELSVGERASMDAAAQRVEVAIVAGDGHGAEAAFAAFDQLIDAALAARQQQAAIRSQFAALSGALGGVDVDADAARELQALRTSIEQAMAGGLWQRAGQQVSDLGALVRELDRAYELRIVSRGNARSGVWRHPNRDRSKRNYYIIVEAIGVDGKPLLLSILSEEDQSTRKVSKFGVRVPKEVYEQVKADKLDNGLIDNVVFGAKRRGATEPDYRFPVAGGRITRW